MKSKIIRVGIFILIATTFFQCRPANSTESTNSQQEASDSISNTFTQGDASIRYAQNFTIENHNTYKVAHIRYKSAHRNLDFSQKIIFLPKGNPKPTSNELADAWLVEVPIQTIAANDDGEITRLKTLNVRESIVAMGGGGIYDTELRKRWEAKQIASIGYSFHSSPQPELILSLQPDVLLLYAYDHQRLGNVTKLRQLGINAIPQFAWAEPSFLGKAEWIKFSALFFDKYEEAQEIFERVAARCIELTQLANAQKDKKRAFLVYHPSGGSDWNAHRNDFYASFLEAAGSENVLKDNGPTHAVGMNNEVLLSLAKDADFWIANSISNQDWPPNNYLQSFKSYQNHNVFHYQKRTRYEHDAYDWYETPEVRPDLVLEDLVSIFYPDLLPEHELLFFDRVKLSK